MPCQCTLCSDAGCALGYVHQDLSARCLGLHFMINIKKKSCSKKDPLLGVSRHGEMVVSSNAVCPQSGCKPRPLSMEGVCVHPHACTHAARASSGSYTAAHSRLLPTSVSTNCFQETGWERKQALMKNPLVKNVFLRLFLSLRGGGREIIKQPRCIPALALGTLMLCYPRALSGGALSPPCSYQGPSCPMLLWEQKHRCGAAPLQLCAAPAAALSAPGFEDWGSHIIPIMQRPQHGHPALVLSLQQMQHWLRDQQWPWGLEQN